MIHFHSQSVYMYLCDFHRQSVYMCLYIYIYIYIILYNYNDPSHTALSGDPGSGVIISDDDVLLR